MKVWVVQAQMGSNAGSYEIDMVCLASAGFLSRIQVTELKTTLLA